MNPKKNFAIGAVATAPVPAASGTSLVLTAGHGARFPATPFEATVWPASAMPDPSNAEIVTVTAIAADTLTITRQSQSTSARTIVAGDLLAATVTSKDLQEPTIGDAASGSYVFVADGFTLLVGDEYDLAAADCELVIEGEVICV